MAKFWEHLRYHEDTTTKRTLTQEEISFLLTLQQEMNTQDHCGTASPRYWVIRDYVEIPVGDLDGDILHIYNEEYDTIYNGEYDFGAIAKALDQYYETDYFSELPSYCFGSYDEISEQIEEYLYESGKDNSVRLCNHKTEPRYREFFLTEKAAAKHLKDNAHHYHKNATTFCLCAWRSPEVEMLWKILQEIDWNRYTSKNDK